MKLMSIFNFHVNFKYKKKQSKINEGFTLAELMITVAIAGVLTSVAIPNFKKYQAKSKTTEAKMHLAAIYTAEQGFSAEWDTFAACLADMGYDSSPEAYQRYYNVGFRPGVAIVAINLYARTLGADCSSPCAYVGNKAPPGISIIGKGFGMPVTSISETGFTAGSIGYISGSYSTILSADKWTINHEKEVVHVNTGY